MGRNLFVGFSWAEIVPNAARRVCVTLFTIIGSMILRRWSLGDMCMVDYPARFLAFVILGSSILHSLGKLAERKDSYVQYSILASSH